MDGLQWRSLAPLPKLLLQHDGNPSLGQGEEHAQLLQALDSGSVSLVLGPSQTAEGSVLVAGLGQRLVVLGLGDGAHDLAFDTVLTESERITSLAVMERDPGAKSTQPAAILVGTSAGFLQLHSPDARLVLRQALHDRALLSLSARSCDAGAGVPHALATFENAVARVAGWDVAAAMQWRARSWSVAGWGGGSEPPALDVAKWTLGRGVGPRAAALCGPAVAPSLHAELARRCAGAAPPPPPALRLLTAGAAPPVASFAAPEQPGSRDLARRAAGAARGAAVRLAASAQARLPPALARATARAAGAAGEEAALPRGTRVVALTHVWDAKRVVHSLAASFCGQWALGCDSLGRVLLIDVATSLVVVMLKGYRAAQAAWMEWPAGGVRGPAPGSSVPVIYAPRKGVLEVWAPDLRTRLAVLRGVGPRGVLLSPRPRGAALWFADLDALRCADVAPALVSAAPCG
ncbi:hypothetical protein ACKKBF_B00505 [Auxenochlorella protothecoides x Auxenochlorella symbiontica]